MVNVEIKNRVFETVKKYIPGCTVDGIVNLLGMGLNPIPVEVTRQSIKELIQEGKIHEEKVQRRASANSKPYTISQLQLRR